MSEKFIKKVAELSHISVAEGSEYKGLRKDMEFVCEFHGKYTAKPDSIFNSYNGCDGCLSYKNGVDFIKKAKKLHGDKYSYDVKDYVCSRTEMRMFCNKHNEYFNQRPSAHLQGQGCDLCGEEDTASTKRRNGVETLIAKSINLFGDIYKYNKKSYTTTKSLMELKCPVHGLVQITPENHIKSETGCRLCDKGLQDYNKTEGFKKKLEELRPSTFDMSKVSYINNTTPVKLKCLEHNEWFEQTPLKMLDKNRNCSCKTCGKLSNNRWTIEAVRKIPKIESKVGYLYIGKVSGIEGFKIGVCEDLNSRFSCYQDDLKPYHDNNFTYIFHREMNYLSCFVGEEILKKVFRDRRFAEKSIKFGGYTEMFSIDNVDDVISIIKDLDGDNILSVENTSDPKFTSLVDLFSERSHE